MPAALPPVRTAKKKPRSCLGQIVLAFLVLILVGVILVIAGLGFGAYFVIHQTDKIASAKKIELPDFPATPEQMAELNKRLDDFQTARETGKPASLVLSSADLNRLACNHTDYEILKGASVFRISDGQAKIALSLPIEKIPVLGGQFPGKFVNAVILLDNSADPAAAIALHVKKLQFENKEAEELALQLSGALNDNLQEANIPGTRAASQLKGVSSLRLEGDSLVIKANQP